MATFKPGDRVVVPWGLDELAGTVLSLLGPQGQQIARVEIEMEGEANSVVVQSVSLPVDILQLASVA